MEIPLRMAVVLKMLLRMKLLLLHLLLLLLLLLLLSGRNHRSDQTTGNQVPDLVASLT